MSIIVWDVASREVKRQLPTGAKAPRGMAVSQHGDVIAAFVGSKIKMRKLETGRPIEGTAEGHEGVVTGIRFAPHGRWVATSGSDGSVRIWNSVTGRQLREMRHNQRVRSIAVSPDATLIASSSLDGGIRLWRSETGEELFRLAGHGQYGGRRQVVFTENGNHLMSWCDDMMLRTWDVQTGQAVKEHKIRLSGVPVPADVDEVGDSPAAPAIDADAFSPNGDSLVIGTGTAVHLFDSTTGQETQKIPVVSGASAVALSPTGTRLFTSGRAGRNERHPLRLINVTTGKELWKYESAFLRSTPVAFSADGSLMAAVIATSKTGEIKVWDSHTHQLKHTIDLPSENLWQTSRWPSLAFSPDGTQIAYALLNSTVLIWNLAAQAP